MMNNDSIMELHDECFDDPVSAKGLIVGSYFVAVAILDRIQEILHTVEGSGISVDHVPGMLRELAGDIQEDILLEFPRDIDRTKLRLAQKAVDEAWAARS